MVNGFARILDGFDAQRTAVKLLEVKYGKQIGKISKTGNVGFKQVKPDGREVVTVLNKYYIESGKLTKTEFGPKRTNYERCIYNYDGDVLVKTNVAKTKTLDKKTVLETAETKYNPESPKKVIEQRYTKLNAQTGDKYEVVKTFK